MKEMNLQVYGVEPGPQGSKRHVGNGRMIEASKKVAPWRAAVALAVQESWLANDGFLVFEGAVEVEVTFYLPRPSSVKRLLPTVAPDVDKLARSTLDGLVQGGALADDSLVVNLEAVKRYADGRPIGADITIRSLQVDPPIKLPEV